MTILDAFRRPKQVVAEIIGRVAVAVPIWRVYTAKATVDATQTDYEWWDKLRRGKQSGYEFGGLFCQPILQIVSAHVWGDGPQLALADGAGADADPETDNRAYTDALLGRWVAAQTGDMLARLQDLYALGDQTLIVNQVDGTISVASPEAVEVERDPLDWETVRKVTIRTRTDTVEIADEYRLDGRTVTVTWLKAVDGHQVGQKQPFQFQNLIGRLPVVLLANDRGANETNGRPIYEPLRHLFSRYDDLIVKALDGAELMGNPLPTFEGMEDINETIDVNATAEDETYTDREGNTASRKTLAFDRLAAVFVGKGGRFDFKSPQRGFTEDIRNLLKSLFLLMLDYTRIPEYLWGGAIASSKASAETQMPPFAQYVTFKRGQLEGIGADDMLGAEARGGLLELADIWLRTRALVDPRVVVAPVACTWPEIMGEDEALQLEKIKYADGTGKLTAKTALELLDLVDDEATEIEKAREEGEEAMRKQAEFSDRLADAEREAAERDDQPDRVGSRNGRQPVTAEAA